MPVRHRSNIRNSGCREIVMRKYLSPSYAKAEIERSGKIVPLIFALCLATVASAENKPLAVEDILELELASDPQVSPDGASVVYVRQFVDPIADLRRSNLWIVETDGTGERPLTSGNFSDGAPRWAPDGASLIYVSDREGSPQVYRLWLDTGTSVKLTRVPNAPSALAWSPDGALISFVSLVEGEAGTIKGMPRPPAGATWAAPPFVTSKLLYRFNNAGYLKPGRTHVFVVPASGGTARQISSGDYDHGGVSIVRYGDPVWSADGKQLFVAVNRRPDADMELLDTEIVSYSLADGAMKVLTDRRGPDGTPAASPDGRRIAYTGFDDRHQGYQVTRLYVMNRDGSGGRALTADFDRDVFNPRWSRDSRSIYFTSVDQGDTGLYVMRADGSSAPRRIASQLATSFNAGGGQVTINVHDTFVATTVGGPDRPGDVAIIDGRGGTKLLSSVNADLFAARALGSVEEIRYKSSKDGRDIQGWLIKPPGFDPAKKYPLVLEIHGGPFADYGPRFDIEKQLLASRGYVVLYTNPRGSTSYGEAFGNSIHHAYPGDDLYDLLSGVDATIARGFVDEKALYVTGGSGGGVLTCWVIGHSDRFRAAATLYPVINWTSFVLTADVGAFASLYWFPAAPWDNVDHYWRRSLLSVVKNVKTPTLVMVGDEDWRTPPAESEQYYQALKMRGVETELIKFPGEPHGIAGRPSHHMAKVLALVGWFDRHR
jgi:dipeptidyl aminopeptidase/acylaminoacyl peptidase